jgi:hypothetical protein
VGGAAGPEGSPGGRAPRGGEEQGAAGSRLGEGEAGGAWGAKGPGSPERGADVPGRVKIPLRGWARARGSLGMPVRGDTGDASAWIGGGGSGIRGATAGDPRGPGLC